MKHLIVLLAFICSLSMISTVANAAIPTIGTLTVTTAISIGEPEAKAATKPPLVKKLTNWFKKAVASDNTAAVLAYLTPIGWLIAFFAFKPYGSLGAFHLRNALGIYLTAITSSIIISILSYILVISALFSIIGWILGLIWFVFLILGFIAALQGKEAGAPLLGPLYQKWFSALQ